MTVATTIKIGLIVDTGNWAFANIALELRKHLSGRIELSIFNLEDFDFSLAKAFMALRDMHLIHIFPRQAFLSFPNIPDSRYIAKLGLSRRKFIEKYVATKIVTLGVYDHQYSSKRELTKQVRKLNQTSAISTSSAKLKAAYESIKTLRPSIYLLQDGVDLQKFFPSSKVVQKPSTEPLIVGWVGNSEWGGADDHKGLNTVIKPAIELLRARGASVKENFADRAVSRVSFEDMPNYYAGVDVLVVASKNEGTPNPILEAMACGVPIVTTDVGIAAEAFGPLQKKFIAKNRDALEFANLIEKLYDPELRNHLSHENLMQIREWSWKRKAKDFEIFFMDALYMQNQKKSH